MVSRPVRHFKNYFQNVEFGFVPPRQPRWGRFVGVASEAFRPPVQKRTFQRCQVEIRGRTFLRQKNLFRWNVRHFVKFVCDFEILFKPDFETKIKNCVQYLKVFNFSTSQVVFRDFMLRWERSEETELPVLTDVLDAKSSECLCLSGRVTFDNQTAGAEQKICPSSTKVTNRDVLAPGLVRPLGNLSASRLSWGALQRVGGWQIWMKLPPET